MGKYAFFIGLGLLVALLCGCTSTDGGASLEEGEGACQVLPEESGGEGGGLSMEGESETGSGEAAEGGNATDTGEKGNGTEGGEAGGLEGEEGDGGEEGNATDTGEEGGGVDGLESGGGGGGGDEDGQESGGEGESGGWVGEKIVIYHNGRGPMCIEALEFLEGVNYPVEEHLEGEDGFMRELNGLIAEYGESEGESESFRYYPMIFVKGKAYSGFNEEVGEGILAEIGN